MQFVFAALLVSWLSTTSMSARDEGDSRSDPDSRRPPRLVVPKPDFVLLMPTRKYTGTIPNRALLALAPKGRQEITDAKTFEKLWKAWRPGEPLPNIDFALEHVIVLTADGPNVPQPRFYRTARSVSWTVARTLRGGPGFGYTFLVMFRKDKIPQLSRPKK